MLKRFASLFLALALLCACFPAWADDGAAAGYGGYYASSATSTLLSSLTHNCPNTGIMLPATFSPYQTTYLLTVASWVSKPTFPPVAYDPNAVITVNGQIVRSGQKSQIIPLTNEPQAVNIVVSNGTASTTYTIYLQRRPSERRTRVSAGYINTIYLKGTTWWLDADLVTIKYLGSDYNSGNYSTFSNSKVEHNVYDYEISPNCIFYYGTKDNCYRAHNVQEFTNNYLHYGNMFTIIYIEDQIVAVMPYAADYY